MPSLMPVREGKSCDECEWHWCILRRSSFWAPSLVSSKIVLEGEAGLGGEPECDVPELWDEKVNVL